MSILTKDYIDATTSGLRWKFAAAVIAFAVVIALIDHKNSVANRLALSGSEEAINVAVRNIEEKDVHRNGLIEQMREQASHYITRGNVYSALIAGGVVVGVYSQIRGTH